MARRPERAPSVEVGQRHDWGDAETGFGLDRGGRVWYADPAWGLTIEGAVRGLLAHEDNAYKEWGAGGSLRIDPGATGPGPLPDPLPNLGRDVERCERPLVAADDRGPRAAGQPAHTGGQPERGSGLWLRGLRHRTPDLQPACGTRCINPEQMPNEGRCPST